MLGSQPISTDHLEKKLKSLTMERCGNNFTTLFTAMEDLRHRIEAEKGCVYNEDHYITGLSAKIQDYKYEEFVLDVRLEKKLGRVEVTPSRRSLQISRAPTIIW